MGAVVFQSVLVFVPYKITFEIKKEREQNVLTITYSLLAAIKFIIAILFIYIYSFLNKIF